MAGDSYIRAGAIVSLVQAVADLEPHQALQFTLPFLTIRDVLKRKIKEINSLLRNKPGDYFYPQEDLFYVIWELIQRGGISDYFFDYHADKLVCTVMSSVPSQKE